MDSFTPSIKEIELSLTSTKEQLKKKRWEISKWFEQSIQKLLEETNERKNYTNLMQAKKEHNNKESKDTDDRVKFFTEVTYPEIIKNIKKECGENEEIACYLLNDYYRAKMDKLPAIERKILLHIAEHRDQIEVATLIKECKMEGKLISAYLHTLNKKGIININKGIKNNAYSLTDNDFKKRIIYSSSNTYKAYKKTTPEDKKRTPISYFLSQHQ